MRHKRGGNTYRELLDEAYIRQYVNKHVLPSQRVVTVTCSMPLDRFIQNRSPIKIGEMVAVTDFCDGTAESLFGRVTEIKLPAIDEIAGCIQFVFAYKVEMLDGSVFSGSNVIKLPEELL